MTGLSGSGKSSLAFDTIYAEGQRRYVESLSSYARQFLGQMDKPDVDSIDGLSPAISIDQKTTSRNPRSTVGTVTEIHDYLQAHVRARRHAALPEMRPRDSAADDRPDRRSAFSRCRSGRKSSCSRRCCAAARAKTQSCLRICRSRASSARASTAKSASFPIRRRSRSTKKHTIEAVVDRLVIRPDIQQRLTDSIETAAHLAGGLVIIHVVDGEDILFSQNYACPDCNISIDELTPRMFSFNNPYGACPACTGLGTLIED